MAKGTTRAAANDALPCLSPRREYPVFFLLCEKARYHVAVGVRLSPWESESFVGFTVPYTTYRMVHCISKTSESFGSSGWGPSDARKLHEAMGRTDLIRRRSWPPRGPTAWAKVDMFDKIAEGKPRGTPTYTSSQCKKCGRRYRLRWTTPDIGYCATHR